MKNKKSVFLFVTVMLLLVSPVRIYGAGTGDTAVARPTSSAVIIDGKNIAFDAYNINDSNYFKLRGIAYALSGVDW